MSERLQEYADSRGLSLRVDQAASLIRGVKILGLESRNGRVYLPEALRAAVPLYEGAKVNVNHARGVAVSPRDYQDRIGSVRQVAFREGEGLFADLFFNPKHALAEQLVWDAEHAPENVGFSHNVEARTVQHDGRVVVEAILKVQSVDLVADPATTSGLFEAAAPAAAAAETEQTPPASTNAERIAHQGSPVPKQRDEIHRLEEDVRRLEHEAARRQRLRAASRLLSEHGLPDWDSPDPRARRIVGPELVGALAEATSEGELRRLVEERAELVEAVLSWCDEHGRLGSRPECREQRLVEGPLLEVSGTKQFVTCISRQR